MTDITAVRTVAIPVKDQDRAVDFYVGTLGLDKRLDSPVPQLGGRWIEVAPAGSGSSLAIIPANEELPAGIHTGIRLTTPDAAALHDELSRAGVEVGELLTWPGVPPMFGFSDPDGNRLEIVEVPS